MSVEAVIAHEASDLFRPWHLAPVGWIDQSTWRREYENIRIALCARYGLRLDLLAYCSPDRVDRHAPLYVVVYMPAHDDF